MKYRARLVGSGGDLDSIEANTLEELTQWIADQLHDPLGWTLSPGDSILIEQTE